MDSQAVNSAGNPKAPTPKPQPSASSSGSKVVATPAPKPAADSVNLSAQAKVLAEVSKGGGTSSSSEQRKFSVTDNNDVVLQVIDPKTQKVVKSIPTEDEMHLKDAIRDGISDITK
jgi:hypothetical protein